MSYYIYNKQGKHEGPYDEEQLRSMLKAGRLDKDELVSQNGLSSWSPIHLVLEARRSPNSSHQEEKNIAFWLKTALKLALSTSQLFEICCDRGRPNLQIIFGRKVWTIGNLFII